MLKPLQEVYNNARTGQLQLQNRQRSAGKSHEYYEKEFNKIFLQLKGIFPSMTNTVKTQKDYDIMRKEWIDAFVESGLNIKQVEAGVMIARQKNTDFLPSSGKFIAWCKEGTLYLQGLPTVIQVMNEFRRYSAERLDYQSAELFPWTYPIMYWIVTDLRKSMLQYNQSELEVEKRAEYLLNQWAKKLEQGEKVPEIRVRIENKPSINNSVHYHESPEVKAMFERIRAKRSKVNV